MNNSKLDFLTHLINFVVTHRRCHSLLLLLGNKVIEEKISKIGKNLENFALSSLF